MFVVKLPQSQGGLYDLFWWHENDSFTYAEGPRTLYKTELEAEGAILWIICRKGIHYFGSLEVVFVDQGVSPCRK